jgi:hypothetical protein
MTSREFPLSISLEYDAWDDSVTDVYDPNITAMIAVVASFCERWHSIKFAPSDSLPLF